MQTDLLRLAKHYSEFSEEEFALIKREDLTQIAQEVYDKEAERRRTPEWESVHPLRNRCPEKASSMQNVIQAMVVEWFSRIFTVTFGIVLFSVLGLSSAGIIPRLRWIETLALVAGISIVLGLIFTFLMLVAYGAVKWLRAYLLPNWTAAEAVPELAVLLPPPVPNHEPPAVSPSRPSRVGGVSPRFLVWGTLLASALVAAVFLVKSARGTYDASSPGLLAGQYTKVTGRSSVSYRVSYTFMARGLRYNGTDTIYQEPRTGERTVYYMAADPRDSGLTRNRLNDDRLVLAGLAFVVAIVAYWRLPTDYFTRAPSRTGVGDSGCEHLRMERGNYDAGYYVGLAFFGQLAMVGVLITFLLSLLPDVSATDDMVLCLAALVAVGFTLWVYWDRWLCIEAYSSKYCSGCANLSILYAPLVALIYANYRAVQRLQGR